MTLRGIITLVILAVLFALAVVWISRQGGWKGEAILEPDGQYCREYLMQDPILTEALLTYLDDGHATDWLRSQKYTLDFIDYCLRLL